MNTLWFVEDVAIRRKMDVPDIEAVIQLGPTHRLFLDTIKLDNIFAYHTALVCTYILTTYNLASSGNLNEVRRTLDFNPGCFGQRILVALGCYISYLI